LVPVRISATGLSLASAAVGDTSATQNITATNNQIGPIALSPVLGGSNSGDLTFGSMTTCGTTLAANSKCVYAIAFAPITTGGRSATLSLTDSLIRIVRTRLLCVY
jgi:hypothetical protein